MLSYQSNSKQCTKQGLSQTKGKAPKKMARLKERFFSSRHFLDHLPIHQSITRCFFTHFTFDNINVRAYINIYLYSFSFSTLQHIPNNPTRTKKKYRIINSLYQEIYYLWYGLLNMKSINYKYVKYTLHICIPNLTFMESNCFINKIREKNP